LVEKRTLVFITLAIFIWAAVASAFAGYYYLQSRNYRQQFGETQDSLNGLASNYDETVSKYNVLLGEYSELYGNYSYFVDSNYAKLIEPFGHLVVNLEGNYTDLLNAQKDLNRTYLEVLSHYEMLGQKENVTREDFGSLLSEYYRLLYQLTIKELTQAITKTVTLSVNISVDYGNGTVAWRNDTQISASSTLFELTQEIATINYTYYALAEPGHVLIDSINDKATYVDPSYSSGYSWIWYYWDVDQKKWIAGPVGCDAWLLKNDGIYKWNYEYWSWP